MFIHSFRCLAFGIASAMAFLSSPTASAQEAWLVVTHEVEDFDRWKDVFDQALATRRSVGELAFYILLNPVDQSMVTCLVQMGHDGTGPRLGV